jgi:pSer/pThr/pTyr-binding forkhead associated (FHA) protein
LEASATKPSVPEGPDLVSGALLGLRVVSSGEILSLIGRDNYTLGRVVEGQPVIPDVDLSPYDAFDQGVSRLHCEIRLKDEGVYIIDLESANGTLINGERIEVQKPISVKHGDILQLGRMRLQLISRYRK